MGAKLAEAYVDITVKMDQLNAGLASAEGKFGSFAAKASSMLSTIGLGIGAYGAGKFFGELAEAGGTLNETMNKVSVVFGGAAGRINAMAEDMAARFGSVKNVTLDAAANLGLVAQGAGLGADESAKLSERLVRLADDASSFFNVPLDVALEKIRSGLVGEAEPLRAFGVLLSESAMHAKALEMGLPGATSALSEQEKVLARVEIITKGLDKAQGDHARTMGSYANQIRRLSGEWENTKASMGAPIAGGLATTMESIRNDGIMGFLAKTGAYYTGTGNPFQAAADKGAGVTTGFTPATAAILDRDLAGVGGFMAALQRGRQNEFNARRLNSGIGPMGMFGDLNQMMMNQAGVTGLDQQIARKRAEMGGWGGSHIMGAADFLRTAQERILKPADETAKKQLDELVKIREALVKQSPAPQGVVLRGRVF